MQCILVTPEQTVRDVPADFVAVPLFDGELGIAPGHSPMIGRLGCGELRIRRADQTDRFYVEGGFVEVIDQTVSVLTGRAMPAERLDEGLARGQLLEARSLSATTPESMAERDRAVARSRAQLRVARRAASAGTGR